MFGGLYLLAYKGIYFVEEDNNTLVMNISNASPTTEAPKKTKAQKKGTKGNAKVNITSQPPAVPNSDGCLTLLVADSAISEDGVHQGSTEATTHTTHTVQYTTSDSMTVRVGSRGVWATELEGAVQREFDKVGSGDVSVAADVPLLQPLWGTLSTFAKRAGHALSGPPQLPAPSDKCTGVHRPLIVLPARWVRVSLSPNTEGGLPFLAVPAAVSHNLLTIAAQSFGDGASVPSFSIPIFAEGRPNTIASIVRALETGTNQGDLWRLLGVASIDEAASMFRSGQLAGGPGLVELQLTGKARVVHVRPECTGECTWCDEVTAVIPLQLRAEIGGVVRNLRVSMSVTEMVCAAGSGGAVPGVADSLAAAVHLGSLIGKVESATHVVVLGEEHVVHTLVGRDRQLYHDGLLGGAEDAVGHTFLEQALGAWKGCEGGGPRATQAVVLRSASAKVTLNATTAAFGIPMAELMVDHHGVIFSSKTVTVPSSLSTKMEPVVDTEQCFGGHACVRMRDMVNAMFHPFTTLEGVVAVRRRHLLPGRSRRVLGVVDPAEVRDALLGPAASREQYAMEAVDAVSPVAVCIDARSFVAVNGLYGRGGGERWTGTVEDVGAALRSRVVPIMARHVGHVACGAGDGGVVGVGLRVVRTVTRRVVGNNAAHAAGEEATVGSSNLNSLVRTRSSNLERGRPTLAQYVVQHAPLVAVSARVVRVPVAVPVMAGAMVEEATLWHLLGPRFVHHGSAREPRGNGLRLAPVHAKTNLAAEALRVSRALYGVVAGAPTNVCVPSGLLEAVQAHVAAMSEYPMSGMPMLLETRLRGEFSPWRHARCEGEDLALCVARGQLRHMQQALECEAMVEWLRRVSDDMRILSMADERSAATMDDENIGYREKRNPSERDFLYISIAQSSTLGLALCQRWGCESGVTQTLSSNEMVVEKQQAGTRADVPGAEVDVSRTVGIGGFGSVSLSRESPAVLFAEYLLSTTAPVEFAEKTSIAHALRSGLCRTPEVCPEFPAAHSSTETLLDGPLTLNQQWTLRYVRMLLQTAPPISDTPPSDVGPKRMGQSGHARLFDGDWATFAWGSLDARTKLSLDFAVTRFLPGGSGGTGPGSEALRRLVGARSVEEANVHMHTALLHLGPTELAPMLRAPLMKEGADVAALRCRSEVGEGSVRLSMALSRAVVRHLRGKTWDMGPDSVVANYEQAVEDRLQCALRGLDWLERGWSAMGSGIAESELNSWVSQQEKPPTAVSTAAWLSHMFTRDLRCMLPPSTINEILATADPTLGRLEVIPHLCDELYFHLQLLVHRRALQLVDTTGVLLLQSPDATCGSTASNVPRSSSLDVALRPGDRVLWRVPCFRCSGFMRETMTYLPPLIEDKAMPLSISVSHEQCMCSMDTTEPTHLPRDVFRRALSIACDNNCMPFVKSGTPFIGASVVPVTYSHVNSMTNEEKVFFGARQRHHRRSSIQSHPNVGTSIWIDTSSPGGLGDSIAVTRPFCGQDIPNQLGLARVQREGSDVGAEPTTIDVAIERSLFSPFNDLRVDIPIISRNTTMSDTPPQVFETREYRICRAMYEADRISQAWMREMGAGCDEIWVPGNWVRRMFINSFVTPYIELVMSPRDSGTSVDMSSTPTTPLRPFRIDIDTFMNRSGLILAEEERVVERLQHRIYKEESTGSSSQNLLSVLLDTASSGVIDGLRQGSPIALFEGVGAGGATAERLIEQPYVDGILEGFALGQLSLQLVSTTTPSHTSAKRPKYIVGIGNTSHELMYRLTFKSSFDLTKIVVLPEALDIHTFDPAVAEPIDGRESVPGNGTKSGETGLFQPGDPSYGWERWCSRKCFRGPPGNRRFLFRNESFRFFSVYKWEPRKGWKQLLESFYRAFYAPLYGKGKTNGGGEPMLVVLGSSYTPEADTFESIFLSRQVDEIAKLKQWPIASLQSPNRIDIAPRIGAVDTYLGRADFPCMCFLPEAVTEKDITSLFRSMDAYALTTRGEGWGLPTSEAMAMGLPTISTNWGGSTEFTSHGSMPAAISVVSANEPVSYGINASIVELPELADGYGGEQNMRMADPSIEHTVELLRQVYEQSREVNTEVGRRARDTIVRQFSQAATTDLMAIRLAAIASKLRGQTSVEHAASLRRQKERLDKAIWMA